MGRHQHVPILAGLRGAKLNLSIAYIPARSDGPPRILAARLLKSHQEIHILRLLREAHACAPRGNATAERKESSIRQKSLQLATRVRRGLHLQDRHPAPERLTIIYRSTRFVRHHHRAGTLHPEGNHTVRLVVRPPNRNHLQLPRNVVWNLPRPFQLRSRLPGTPGQPLPLADKAHQLRLLPIRQCN